MEAFKNSKIETKVQYDCQDKDSEKKTIKENGNS